MYHTGIPAALVKNSCCNLLTIYFKFEINAWKYLLGNYLTGERVKAYCGERVKATAVKGLKQTAVKGLKHTVVKGLKDTVPIAALLSMLNVQHYKPMHNCTLSGTYHTHEYWPAIKGC